MSAQPQPGTHGDAVAVIRRSLKAVRRDARARRANATYTEQAEAVMAALKDAGYQLWGPPGSKRYEL